MTDDHEPFLIIGAGDGFPDWDDDATWEPWATLQAALDDPQTHVFIITGELRGASDAQRGWVGAYVGYSDHLRYFRK